VKRPPRKCIPEVEQAETNLRMIEVRMHDLKTAQDAFKNAVKFALPEGTTVLVWITFGRPPIVAEVAGEPRVHGLGADVRIKNIRTDKIRTFNPVFQRFCILDDRNYDELATMRENLWLDDTHVQPKEAECCAK
jgi:hypothetical protein